MARWVLAQQVIAIVQEVGGQFLAQAAAGLCQNGDAEGLRQPEHGFLLIRVQGADEEHQPLHGAEAQHLRNGYQRTTETRGGRGIAHFHIAEIGAGGLGFLIQAHVQVQGKALAE